MHAQDSNENIEEASKLIVMVAGKLDSKPAFGVEFFFGLENNAQYIVTADHIAWRGEEEANTLTIKRKSKPNTLKFKIEFQFFDRNITMMSLFWLLFSSKRYEEI